MFILRSSSPFRAIWSQPRPVEAPVAAAVTEIAPLAKPLEEPLAEPLEESREELLEVAPPEEPTSEPFIDQGLPLPEDYPVDIIRAMMQDPFRIFIYWRVREQSLKALTRYFSEADAAEFRTTLKLREVAGGNEAFFEVGRQGRYWMTVFPDREYEFEVGVRSPKHGYIALVRSNRVRTPRGTVSPERAPESEYRLTPPQFMNVLEASGFAADQLYDVTIAAAHDANAGDEQLTDIVGKLPESVRDAVVTAAMGGPLTQELIAALPEPLHAELLKLQGGGDGRLAAAGLVHYLPELLREAIEDQSEPSGEYASPLHIPPRFFFGSSEHAPGGDTRRVRLPQARVPGSPF
jgi:hypothetical protein